METFTPSEELALTSNYVEDFLQNKEKKEAIMALLQNRVTRSFMLIGPIID